MKVSTLDLRLFAAIVDLGGISAAARHLEREKSSVSRELAALEARLGVRLLQRTTRRIAPTEAGEVLAAYARRVVEELENAEAAIESLSDAPRGQLRVTAPHALIRFVLAPRLAAFEASYPELRVSLDPTVQVLDLVEAGFDLALRVGELPPSSLVARKLHESPLVLVATREYLRAHGNPRDAQALARHRLIALHAQANADRWALHAGDKVESVEVVPRFVVPDPGIVLDLALQGLGIATVPLLYAAAHIVDKSLVRVLPRMHRGLRPIHAVYPSRRQLTPKVRAFVEFAAEAIAAAAAPMGG